MSRSLAILLVALILTAGCSFVLVDAPPTIPTSRNIECTRSRTWPLVDTAMTVLTAAAGATTLAVGIADDDSTTMAIGGGTAVLAIPFAIAAVSGFKKTTQCRVYVRVLKMIPGGK